MNQQLKHAIALAQSGKVRDADIAFAKVLAAEPENHQILAAAATFHYRQSRQIGKAAQLVDRLIKKQPKVAGYQVLAAEVFLRVGNRRRAMIHAKHAYDLSPGTLNVLVVNAAVRIAETKFDAALKFVTKALKMAPGDLGVKYQHAQILASQGKMDETLSCVEDILDQSPHAIEALGIYVAVQKLTVDDPKLKMLRDEMLPDYKARKDPRLPQLLKLLGKAHNEIAEYDSAFSYFASAKAIEPARYDPKAYAAFVGTICETIDRSDFFERGHDSDRPILLVGMPRCGSTLLEQILAGHRDIGSAGESLSLRRIVRGTGVQTHHGPLMVKAIKEMPADAATRLATRYLNETNRAGARRVVDKSLHNFELLGFFAAMLPNARIIHVTRDPMDNCVSCYMQNLPASHHYTQSLDAIGHMYMQHLRLMDHWRKVLPNPIHTIRYEDVVNDIEGAARKAIGFLKLAWDDACLDFQNVSNQVQTISVRQVREPLYHTSMQRWRRYEAHLDPLKRRLAALYPDGFDAPSR